MVSIENPVEIQLSLGNPIYRGPEGKKPVKGVDYFTQEDIDSIVAQIEGEEGINLTSYATKEYVNEAVSGVVVSETDPTVPEWAKQANKPSYTANEVGALPADTQLFSGDYNDLTNKPTIPTVPPNVSAFTNDAGYLTDVEFHDTMNKTTVSVNDVGLYVETLDNEQNPVYRTDVINMGVSANGPSGVVAMSNGQLMFGEPTNGNMLTVSIDENADSLYVNGDKVALVSDIPVLTDYATKSYVETAIRGAESGLLKRSVVQALPVSDIDEDTIYMVAKTGSTGDVYDEYLYVNSNWEHIGSTDVDLTDYRKAVYLETSENLDAESIAILNEIYNHIVSLNLSNNSNSNVLPSYDIFVNGEHIEYFKKYNTTISLLTGFYRADKFLKHEYVWTKDDTRLWANGVSSISGNDLFVENENSVAGAYPNNRIGTNFKYIKDNYATQSYVDTAMPEYLTNTDILAIWNGNNEQ